jgi:hypothetical protein
VEYLANKFTNAALYDWMSEVLQGVYQFFLQQATAMAQIAARQLAFERQQQPPMLIQADYWSAGGTNPPGGAGADVHGLVGAERLQQDIYNLDQWAFTSSLRSFQLTKTLSLMRLAPLEFREFLETGVMQFASPMQLFDQDFPGHYLRLIHAVRVSVIALVPAVESIKATLIASGNSRVVVDTGVAFRTVTIKALPQSVALTAPRDATGLFDLQPLQNETLLPFEGSGVDTSWSFQMPKAANRFDYNSIADVLITLQYTAYDNDIYRMQVIRTLDSTLLSDRPFSLKQDFADAWWGLNNPDQNQTPMTVEFRTLATDFPPNLDPLAIKAVVLYFSQAKDQKFEVDVKKFTLTPPNGAPVGGAATTMNGMISTRQGNGFSWLAMLGLAPVGTWRLELPDTTNVRKWFQDGLIRDIACILSYSGGTPKWPF